MRRLIFALALLFPNLVLAQVSAPPGLSKSQVVPIANLPIGITAGTVAAGNDSRITGAIQSGGAATLASILANTFTTSGNLAWTGATGTPYFNSAGSINGSNTSTGYPAIYNFAITDQLLTSTLVDVISSNIAITSKSAGGRQAVHGNINITGAPSIPGPYVAVWGNAHAGAPSGGGSISGQGLSSYLGGAWGAWDLNTMDPGSTGYYSAYGAEVDSNVSSTSHPAEKITLAVVDQGGGGGDYMNAAVNLNGMNSWWYGLQVGKPTGDWPLLATSTIIGATRREYGRPSSQPDPTALFGVDFRQVAFATGGSAYASNNFAVDPTGVLSASTLTTLSTVKAFNATLTGITISNGGIYSAWPTFTVAPPPSGGTTATVTVASVAASSVTGLSSSGSAYVANDVVTLAGGTGTGPQLTVSTVSSTGGVSGLTALSNGTLTVPPANPVTVTGGTGTGAYVNIIWQQNGAYYAPASWTYAATGSGYVSGNSLTVVGDTGTAAIFTVGTVTAQGGVMTASVSTAGALTAISATSTHAVTGGAGTGAGITVGYTVLSTTTTPGSGYLPNPLPLIYNVGATNNQIATLTPVMTSAQTALALNPGGSVAITGNLNVNTIAASGGVVSGTISGFSCYKLPAGGTSFPQITLTAPPTGGSQATANVTSMNLACPSSASTITAAGTGYVANDVLTVVGGTCTTAPLVIVNSVSSGGVTAVGGYNGGRCTSLPADPVSFTGGHGTGAKISSMGWAVTDEAMTVTAAGSGYLASPTGTISVGTSGTTYYTGTISITTVLSNSLSISGAGINAINITSAGTTLGTSTSGQVTLTPTATTLALNGTTALTIGATGTSIGVVGASGTPVISVGASIDGSGVRQSLNGTTYTVPANTSLVRFTQGGTLAAMTVTLPTALADGQPIQFVNYLGTITSFNFSPAVLGWTNGNSVASYQGIRIRWDTTSAAWIREQ